MWCGLPCSVSHTLPDVGCGAVLVFANCKEENKKRFSCFHAVQKCHCWQRSLQKQCVQHVWCLNFLCTSTQPSNFRFTPHYIKDTLLNRFECSIGYKLCTAKLSYNPNWSWNKEQQRGTLSQCNYFVYLCCWLSIDQRHREKDSQGRLWGRVERLWGMQTWTPVLPHPLNTRPNPSTSCRTPAGA